MWSYVVLPWGREGCCCADGVRSGPSLDRGGGQTLQVCPGVLTHPLWLGCDHALPREPMGMLMPLCLNKSRSLSCSPPSGRASPDRDCLGTSHLPWGGGRPVGPALSLSAVRESPWVLAVVVTAQSGTSRSTSTDLSALGEAQVGSGQSRVADLEEQEGQSGQCRVQLPSGDCLVALLAGTLAGLQPVVWFL